MTDEEYAAQESTQTYDTSLDDMTEDEEGWQVATGDESEMGPMVNDGEPPLDGPPSWLDEPEQP